MEKRLEELLEKMKDIKMEYDKYSPISKKALYLYVTLLLLFILFVIIAAASLTGNSILDIPAIIMKSNNIIYYFINLIVLVTSIYTLFILNEPSSIIESCKLKYVYMKEYYYITQENLSKDYYEKVMLRKIKEIDLKIDCIDLKGKPFIYMFKIIIRLMSNLLWAAFTAIFLTYSFFNENYNIRAITIAIYLILLYVIYYFLYYAFYKRKINKNKKLKSEIEYALNALPYIEEYNELGMIEVLNNYRDYEKKEWNTFAHKHKITYKILKIIHYLYTHIIAKCLEYAIMRLLKLIK